MNVEIKFLFKHNVSYFIRLVLELKIVKIVKNYVINFEKKKNLPKTRHSV